MSESEIVHFDRPEGESGGFVLVRRMGPVVGLTVSLRENGDAEAALDHDEVRRIISALQRAIED